MTFKQPFCVCDHDEVAEEDLKGHDPFDPFDRVSSTPDRYLDARTPGVDTARFDRSHVKHVFYVFNEAQGHELCLTIFAELKDGRLVALHELVDDEHQAVNFWSASDRPAFLIRLKECIGGFEGAFAEHHEELFARMMEGQTVHDVCYVYPKQPKGA